MTGITISKPPRKGNPDAYYCELVDEEGGRHWSDVMMAEGVTMQQIIEGAAGLASCEIDPIGMRLRLYPLHLSNPAQTVIVTEEILDA